MAHWLHSQVWRSYHVLAQRRYIRLGLVSLYVAEVGEYKLSRIQIFSWFIIAALIIVGIIIGGIIYLDPSDGTNELVQKFNILQGIALCVTVLTSVSATFVIGAQIYASTAVNHQARRRYKHVIEIIIQSSALYSISLLITAIISLINTNAKIAALQSVLLNLDAGVYANAISSFTTVCSIILIFREMWLSQYLFISHLHRRSWWPVYSCQRPKQMNNSRHKWCLSHMI